MAWMTAGPVKVLMGIGRFGVQVSADFAVTIDYLNVKKRDTCSRFGLFKLDVWIKRITEVKEVSKFFFTVSPYKEDVIYVPEPHEWFVGGSFLKMIFQATHVEICIARCNFSPHCCPRLLNKVFALKGEIVASKNKVDEFYDSFSFVVGEVMETHKIVACFYATIMWDVCL